VNIKIIGFLATALGLLIWSTWRQADLFAVGCDSFGYARQAELFRDRGLLKGLDTRIDVQEAQFLVDVAKTITADTSQWSEAVAPHCHHYNAAVDHVILEYPPGAGLVLSIFPENVSLGLAFIIGMVLVCGVFVCIVAARPPNAWGLAAALASLVLIQGTMAQWGALDSASVPISIVLIPLCAWLALAAFPLAARRADPSLAFLLGLAAGLLSATRLANIFLLAGIACAVIVNRQLWRPAMIRQSIAAILAAVAGFAVTGLALILTANWINAGSPLATTYSPIDAAPPVLATNLFSENLSYYLGTGFAAPAVFGALAALIMRGVLLWRFPSTRRNYGASSGALACYLLSLIYFCTHSIRIPYYMLPASVMTLCLLVFDILEERPVDNGRELTVARSVGLVAPLLIFAIVRCAFVTARPHKAVLPDEVRAPQSIVWADLTNGTSFYYQNKYAAKINFADPCMQGRLVHEVSARGRAQYLIEDSPSMSETIRRISRSVQIEKTGVFDTYKRFPIWKVAANSHWLDDQCDRSK
jgi:hypothetical protein